MYLITDQTALAVPLSGRCAREDLLDSMRATHVGWALPRKHRRLLSARMHPGIFWQGCTRSSSPWNAAMELALPQDGLQIDHATLDAGVCEVTKKCHTLNIDNHAWWA